MAKTGPHAILEPTFRDIEKRLARFKPPIVLRDHIIDNPASVADLRVHPLIIQGVDFTVKDPDNFVRKLEAAKDGTDPAFEKGTKTAADWKQHWPMNASLMATKGIGFREPWRLVLSDTAARMQNNRPSLLSVPKMDRGFAARFGAASSIELAALHIGVAFGKRTMCQIHVDKTGIAMRDLLGDVTITPNVIHHFFNELLFKYYGAKVLPTWFIDRVNLHVFSPEMGYKRIGIGVDIFKRNSYKFTVSASCGLSSCKDIRFTKILKMNPNALKSINPTINFMGTFDLGGG